MAITLDTIVNKVFKVVKNGYDNNEVEAFLDEILEEMENREAKTHQLEEQVASLTKQLDEARAQLAARPAAAPAPVAPAVNERRSSESFELVLNKAQSAYEEIVAAAEARADEIVKKANADASTIRTSAEGQIADLTAQLTALRQQTTNYCASLSKLLGEQNASMERIKKLL